MFNIGDLVVYSSHGICHIDDISEKTYLGVTKSFYTLHPIDNCKLRISTPVDNEKVPMLELLSREDAEIILESFKLPGIVWNEADNQRNGAYSEIVKKGNRKEISMIANTLMRKELIIQNSGKKLCEKDNRLLTGIQSILFTELAYTLETTSEEIHKKVVSFISESN